MKLQKISIEWAICAQPKDKIIGSISAYRPLSSRPPASEVSIISFYGETNGLTLYGGCVIAYRADTTPPNCYDSVYHSGKFFSVEVAQEYAVLILECQVPHMAHPDSLLMQRVEATIAREGGEEKAIEGAKRLAKVEQISEKCLPTTPEGWLDMQRSFIRDSEAHHIMAEIYKESITGRPQCGHIAPLSVRDHAGRPGE